jgi:hypothetical protein
VKKDTDLSGVTALTTNQVRKRYSRALPFPLARAGVELLANQVQRADDGTCYWSEKFTPEQVSNAYQQIPEPMRQQVEAPQEIYSVGEQQYSRQEIHNALTNQLCGS